MIELSVREEGNLEATTSVLPTQEASELWSRHATHMEGNHFLVYLFWNC